MLRTFCLVKQENITHVFSRTAPPWLCIVHITFTILTSLSVALLPITKKWQSSLMKFDNLKTCGNIWENNSNSTHVDWRTAKHHFSRPRYKQDCNPRGQVKCIVVYTRNLLPVSRPRCQPFRYLKLSNTQSAHYRWKRGRCGRYHPDLLLTTDVAAISTTGKLSGTDFHGYPVTRLPTRWFQG